MKRLVRCLLLLALGVTQPTFATGIVRIAKDDCAGLKAAVAAAQLNGPAVDIVLANRGNYGYCPIAASGNVTIDGSGASLQVATAPYVASISVATGAKLTLRNLNLVPTPTTIPPVSGTDGCGFTVVPLPCAQIEQPIFANSGTLVLDVVAISGVDMSYGYLLASGGDLVLRNSSIVNNLSGTLSLIPVGPTGTTIEIDHSTIALNTGGYGLFYADTYAGKGVIRVSNSIVMPTYGPICYMPSDMGEFVSGGGNVFGDNSCDARAQNDRVVADARFLEFGTHGGVVSTLALNYDSVAIGNGVAANCEATTRAASHAARTSVMRVPMRSAGATVNSARRA